MSTDKKKSEDKNKAEEPEAAYNKKKVVFFDSLEVMNKYDHRYYANMTPEERLQTVLKIRRQVWPEEQTSKPFARHVYFKNDGDNF